VFAQLVLTSVFPGFILSNDQPFLTGLNLAVTTHTDFSAACLAPEVDALAWRPPLRA
jgi:hypothetical protein